MIRLARSADLGAINQIYNYFVAHSTCTYQEEPSTDAEREAWLAAHGPEHPATVAEVNGQVVGWGSLSPFKERSAYRFTVENSVYVRHDQHRRGIGAAPLANLIERAQALGYHVIIAGIDREQSASIAIHRKFDFTQVGHLKQVGFKLDRWLDVIYMQKLLKKPVTNE